MTRETCLKILIIHNKEYWLPRGKIVLRIFQLSEENVILLLSEKEASLAKYFSDVFL
jgi:hypothetical protein